MAAMTVAGAAIIGDYLSAQGQQSANAQSLSNIQQEETWMEQMSNTAMQRRVSDLKAAGLNPLLAVGQGGASTPGIGPAQIGNANMAAGNLGSQIGGAEQTAANVALTNAQANKTVAETKNVPLTGDNLEANTAVARAQLGLTNASAAEVATRVGVNLQTVEQIKASIPGVEANSDIATMNRDQQDALFTKVLQARAAQAQADMTSAQYQNFLNTDPVGKVIQALGHGDPAGALQAGWNVSHSGLFRQGQTPPTNSRDVEDSIFPGSTHITRPEVMFPPVSTAD